MTQKKAKKSPLLVEICPSMAYLQDYNAVNKVHEPLFWDRAEDLEAILLYSLPADLLMYHWGRDVPEI